jgi:hypothetical protein
MKNIIALLLLAAAACGCQTALVYTGGVKAADNQKAVAVSKTIEAEYAKQGLQLESDFPAPPDSSYSTDWIKPVGNTHGITLGVVNWVKGDTVFIRIEPQPGCNDVSQEFGEHMRSFMATNFADAKWKLEPRSEADWFR